MGAAAALALAPALAGCGGEEETAGGAADLPGPVPSGIEFRDPPAQAPRAPDFSVELVDGTPLTASDLWAERPVVLVFTASYCDRCADLHRELARVVAEHEGAIGLLGIAPDDDTDAEGYAEELGVGQPLALAGERIWLNYAAREPGLVALVARGGRVLRGWPQGISAEELAPHLDDLIER